MINIEAPEPSRKVPEENSSSSQSWSNSLQQPEEFFKEVSTQVKLRLLLHQRKEFQDEFI